MTVYTFGYRRRRIADLQTEVIRLKGMVVDVRFMPFTRDQVWSKRGLERVFRTNYRWVRALGNKNYKSWTAPTELENAEAGAGEVERVIREGFAPILLCACKEPEECHRTNAALAVASRMGPACSVEHLMPAQKATQGGLW